MFGVYFVSRRRERHRSRLLPNLRLRRRLPLLVLAVRHLILLAPPQLLHHLLLRLLRLGASRFQFFLFAVGFVADGLFPCLPGEFFGSFAFQLEPPRGRRRVLVLLREVAGIVVGGVVVLVGGGGGLEVGLLCVVRVLGGGVLGGVDVLVVVVVEDGLATLGGLGLGPRGGVRGCRASRRFGSPGAVEPRGR